MNPSNERRLPDGRVELIDTAAIEQSPLYNHDLAPVPIARRTWTTYNFAALWISMAHCIPTYMLASGLMASGMSWWQAVLTILLGNLIVLIPILLNSHPGTRYGIPFPVFARAAYGTLGSNLPALMRALVACGWFGIQAWIGGEALHTLFTSLVPAWPTLLGAGFGGHTTTEWLSFLLFWGINVYIIYRGMDLLRRVENWAAPFVLVMTLVLLIWAVSKAGGLGPLLSQPGRLNSAARFWPVFIPSLTAMVGYWATLSLNMPDFTRFGRGQREQIVGQVVALPTTMSAFAMMGVMITSATVLIYGETIWDPIKLVGRFHQPVVVAISMFTAVVATLAVNIAANVVSPANDFANAFPKLISFRTGGLIAGILGIVMQPWRLLADPSGYIFAWLVGYSGGLGSIAGVLIADYWVVRRRELALEDLYLPQGTYRYRGGWNWKAVVATLVGCALAWGGLIIPPLRPLYDYAWFVGFAAAFGLYVALTKARRTQVSDPGSIMRFLLCTLLLASPALRAQAPLQAPWDSVGKILKTSGTQAAGYYRYGWPRRDITLRIGDVTVAPALALGAWAGFAGDPNAATMMGDLVLTADEVGPVLAELATQHIGVTAIHNHIVGDPQVTYVHVHADGAALDLAARLDRVLSRTKTPRPVTATALQPVTIDTASVFGTLGLRGRAQGNVAQLSTVLVAGSVTMDGRPLTPALAYGTPINIQLLDGGRAVATGDFSITADKVAPVMNALTSHHITATALHTHLIGETPKIYYMHFWADGQLADVLSGLRAALDAAR